MKKNQSPQFTLAVSIALMTFTVYLPALFNKFVDWDDGPYVFLNPHIRKLNTAFFKWAFSDYSVSYWHPLTWISHAFDYAAWGLNPLGHHLTNILLHAANTFAVVFLAVRLLETVKAGTAQNPSSLLSERSILIAAGTTGLLFGLHPVHVESVAWVAERKDLLCGLFYLLSLIAYVKYAGGRGAEVGCQEWGVGNQQATIRRYYFAALGFFILALLSKPMAVTLPVVLLILDWYPLKRLRSLTALRAAVREKIPFFAMTLGLSILTVLAQKSAGALGLMGSTTISTRLLVGARSLAAYLGKMLWPADLIPFYSYPKEASFFSWAYLVPVVVVTGITIACGIAVKKQKSWPAAWCYYVVTLLPVLGLVQAGQQSMADRYTYLPSLGPFFVTGLAVAWIWERMHAANSRTSRIKAAGIAAAVLVLASLSYLTVNQTGIWKNSIVLWTYIIEKEPETCAFAYSNRGLVFGDMGRYDKSITDFDKAIALDPDYAAAYNNRGVVCGKAGLYDEALASFTRSLSLNPNSAETFANRGLVYSLMNQYDRAIEDLNKAIELKQGYAEAYYARGGLYLRTGRRAPAISDFQKGCAFGDASACDALRRVMEGPNSR